jgi:hypothetical protein
MNKNIIFQKSINSVKETTLPSIDFDGLAHEIAEEVAEEEADKSASDSSSA